MVLICLYHVSVLLWQWLSIFSCFFFQAEDGIRDLVRSRGLGDVYKRQVVPRAGARAQLCLPRLDAMQHVIDVSDDGDGVIVDEVQELSLIHI